MYGRAKSQMFLYELTMKGRLMGGWKEKTTYSGHKLSLCPKTRAQNSRAYYIGIDMMP